MKTSRKKPLYAFVRQARWLIWRQLSAETCCFCGKNMYIGADMKHLNNVTLHHLEGSKETDDYDKPADCEKLRFAHSKCHKAFHLLERLESQGKNINRKRLSEMRRILLANERG